MRIIKESDIQKDTKYMVRIAKYGEFDNGRVLRNYRKMYPDDAEKLAKQASEKDPNNIYYVYYGDIMLDGSDLRWINGKSYHYSQVKMTPDGPVIKESKIIKEDRLNYNNPDMKKLRNAVRGIVVDSDEEFISLVDSMINDEPINYVPETRKLKNAIDSVYVDSDEELRELVLDVARDQGIIS